MGLLERAGVVRKRPGKGGSFHGAAKGGSFHGASDRGGHRRTPSAGSSNGSSYGGSAFGAVMDGRGNPVSRASLIAEHMAGGSGRRAGERAPRAGPADRGPAQPRRGSRSFHDPLPRPPFSSEAEPPQQRRRARSKSAKRAPARRSSQGSGSQPPQYRQPKGSPHQPAPQPPARRAAGNKARTSVDGALLVVDEKDRQSLRSWGGSSHERMQPLRPQEAPREAQRLGNGREAPRPPEDGRPRPNVECEDPADRARSVARAFMDEVDANAKQEAKRELRTGTHPPKASSEGDATSGTSEESPVCVGQNLSPGLRPKPPALPNGGAGGTASPATAKPTVGGANALHAPTNDGPPPNHLRGASSFSPVRSKPAFHPNAGGGGPIGAVTPITARLAAIVNANEARMRFPPPPPRPHRQSPPAAPEHSAPAARSSVPPRPAPSGPGTGPTGPSPARDARREQPPEPPSTAATDPRAAAARGRMTALLANAEAEAPASPPPAPASPAMAPSKEGGAPKSNASPISDPPPIDSWKSPVNGTNVDERLRRLAELATGRPSSSENVPSKSPLTRANVDARISRLAELPFPHAAAADSNRRQRPAEEEKEEGKQPSMHRANVDERLRRLAELATGRPSSSSDVPPKSPLTRANVDARIMRLAELPFAGAGRVNDDPHPGHGALPKRAGYSAEEEKGEGPTPTRAFPPPPKRAGGPSSAAASAAPVAASVPTKESDGPSHGSMHRSRGSFDSLAALNSIGNATGIATAPGELNLETLDRDLEETRRQLTQAQAAIALATPPPPREAAKAGGEAGGKAGPRKDYASFLTETRRQLGQAQEAIARANPSTGTASPTEAPPSTGDGPKMPRVPETPKKSCLKSSAPTARKGKRKDYSLGDIARHESHMTVEPDVDKAAAAVATLNEQDHAFVKRSDGRYSYAILARRSKAEDGDEEGMTFVLSPSGCTKTVHEGQWGEFIRMVATDNANAANAAPPSLEAPATPKTEEGFPSKGDGKDDDDDDNKSNTDLEAYIAKLRKEFYGARKELEAKARGEWRPPSAIWVDPTLAALEDDTMSAVSTPFDLLMMGSVNGDEEGEGYAPGQPAILE